MLLDQQKQRSFHNSCIMFYRKDLPFNEKSLDPILKHLEARWLNVRNGTGEYDFWKHEWLKHGTCAVQLKPMDSEIKYFNQGKQIFNLIRWLFIYFYSGFKGLT